MTIDLLDTEMRTFVERYLERSGLSTATSVAQQRLDYEAMLEAFRSPHPDGIETHDSLIQGRHGSIPLRHYHYRGGNADTLLFFLHGGGFILGSLDSHDDICAELCANTGFDLVSVSYRLSPEHQHPTHLDDVEDAFAQIATERSLLIGASAGATLAAGLSFRRRNDAHKALAQVLIYPSLGGDFYDLEAYRENAQAPLLSSDDIRYYRNVRSGDDPQTVDDPEFYPLLADDFRGCPPTIAISADIDPLRDDARLYVDKLLEAGVSARWINEPGLVHDFLRARHLSRRAAEAFSHICEAVRELSAGS